MLLLTQVIRSKWFWLALVLVITNAFTAYKAYQWRDYKYVKEQLQDAIRANELNIETAKRREAALLEAIEKANEAARVNAEQKALDDQALAEYDTVVEDLLHAIQNPDDLCFDSDTTHRLREQFQKN